MVIFIGDKPSAKMRPDAKPFEGAACEARLKEWINELIGLSQYIIYNQSELHFPYPHFFVPFFCKYPIIALGNNAAKFLQKNQGNYFKLPHPSGLNRQINDKEFITKKLKECKLWLKNQT